MDQLKQNGFWIVVGVLVLGALGVAGYRVVGIGGDIDASIGSLDTARITMQGEIIDQGDKAPNRSYPDVFQARAREVNRVLRQCYKEYGDTDDKLEMWIEGGKLKAADAPPGGKGPWQGRYTVRGQELKAELEKKGIKVGVEVAKGTSTFGGPLGKPASKEEEGGLCFIDANDMKDYLLKMYQKQWLIQERFVQAVLSTPNVARVEKVEFPSVEAQPGEGSAPLADGAPAGPTYQRPAIIKVVFRLQVMYGDVATFLTKLMKLDSGSDYPIRFRNVDLRVSKVPMIDGKQTDVDDFTEDVPSDGFDIAKWKPMKNEDPKPVRVEVSAEVLDFDIPKDQR